MSVLVTGGAGYIGSHMVWELLDHGEDVIVLDNLCTGFQWAVPERAQLVIGNVGDIDLVSDIIRDNKVDTIIHFAGSIEVAESIENPLKYYDNNTGQTRNLLEAAVRTGIEKFIFSSSRLWNPADIRSHSRGRHSQSDVTLWIVEADERNYGARHGTGPRYPLCDVALLQCGRK